MKKLIERKFILPAAAMLIGATMVWTDKLQGSEWALMITTLISGFYAIKGWDNRNPGGKNDGNKGSDTR